MYLFLMPLMILFSPLLLLLLSIGHKCDMISLLSVCSDYLLAILGG
jgi:hypothetical protein